MNQSTDGNNLTVDIKWGSNQLVGNTNYPANGTRLIQS
jgi:hypothetical protein